MKELTAKEVSQRLANVFSHYGTLIAHYEKTRRQQLLFLIAVAVVCAGTVLTLGASGVLLIGPVIIVFFIQRKDNIQLLNELNRNSLLKIAAETDLRNTLIPPVLLSELQPFIGGVHGVTFAELKFFANVHKNNARTLWGATHAIQRFSKNYNCEK